MDDYRQRAAISFEECVQLVFAEIEAGKYARPGGIKAAIEAIAAVHYEKVAGVQKLASR